MLGRTTAGSGRTTGVKGVTRSADDDANGVYGEAAATSGTARTVGVRGLSRADAAPGIHPRGVEGLSRGDGPGWGVFGRSDSSDGYGVVGDVTTRGFGLGSGTPTAVVGATDRSSADTGVDYSAGVSGFSSAGSGLSYGVRGRTASPTGYGMFAESTAADGRALFATGEGNGVTGRAQTRDGYAVIGDALSQSGRVGISDGRPTGVYGVTDRSSADSGVTSGAGLSGLAAAQSGRAYGVRGRTRSPDGYGVYAETSASGGTALLADLNGNDGTALLAKGDATVEGTLAVENVGVEAYLSSTQSVAHATDTTVEFDATVADDTGDFDTGTGTYTIPFDGDYQVDLAVNLASEAPLYPRVERNGSQRLLRARQNTADRWVHLSKTVKSLNAGDTLRAVIRQTSGSSVDLMTGRGETYLSVNRIA